MYIYHYAFYCLDVDELEKREGSPQFNLRYGKRAAMPSLNMRYGKRVMPSLNMRYGKRAAMPSLNMRYGKRASLNGVIHVHGVECNALFM